VARNFEQIQHILTAAFGSNDFDGFQLNLDLGRGQMISFADLGAGVSEDSENSFRWTKPGIKALNSSSLWTIALSLLSSSNRACGTLRIYRLYSRRDLQLDVNLLTAIFPTALADALDRTLTQPVEVITMPEQEPSLLPAQAG
jgi:hypothetical protein